MLFWPEQFDDPRIRNAIDQGAKETDYEVDRQEEQVWFTEWKCDGY